MKKVGDSIFLWNRWTNKPALLERKIIKVGRVYWTLESRVRVRIDDLSVENDRGCKVWLSKEDYEAHQKKIVLCVEIQCKSRIDNLMRLNENDLLEIRKKLGD